MTLIWYVLLIWFALMGVIALALFYVAMWIVAAFAAAVMIGLRAARGQRGNQLWRKPFTPRLKITIPATISQARYSNRR
jgi:hypothetical protein